MGNAIAAMNIEEITIRPIDRNAPAEAEAAARIMSSTEPFIRLGRGFEHMIVAVNNPQTEPYVAVAGECVVGVILISINAPLIRGYIGGLAIAPEWRNKGLGTRLMRFAEAQIGRESPNVFLCVSSFNPDAKRFYDRLGYKQVGELTDYIIAGQSELLMRKTSGPHATFRPEITR